jgi:hypothetical protein
MAKPTAIAWPPPKRAKGVFPKSPPGLKRATSVTKTCHTCEYMAHHGNRCTKYDWPVDATLVCNSYEKKPVYEP